MICCSRASGLCLVHRSTFLSSPGRASQCQFISGKTKIKTHTWFILSRLVHVSGFTVMERCVTEAVERSPHQQPVTGPDSRLRGSQRGAPIAYLCLQQVRRAKKHRFQTVLPVTGHPWTGHGQQVKSSRKCFLRKEVYLDCAANKNHHFFES